MPTCPNCGKRNPKSNKFCGECGTDLSEVEMYCQNCGKTLTEGEKFCTDCGNKLINKNEYKIKTLNIIKERKRYEDEFYYLIENNLDDLCRIYSIPKLGRKYVITYLTNNYSYKEVIETFNKY